MYKYIYWHICTHIPNWLASLITFVPTLLYLPSVTYCYLPIHLISVFQQRKDTIMECITTSMQRSLKKYWKRRKGYQRMNKSVRKTNTVKLGGGATTGTKKKWRIKISPKIKFPTISSPKKWMVWMRDSYVRMMLGLANSKVMNLTSFNDPTGGFGRAPQPKEYDNKMLVHMYNSLVVAQGHLVPLDNLPSKLGSETAWKKFVYSLFPSIFFIILMTSCLILLVIQLTSASIHSHECHHNL